MNLHQRFQKNRLVRERQITQLHLTLGPARRHQYHQQLPVALTTRLPVTHHRHLSALRKLRIPSILLILTLLKHPHCMHIPPSCRHSK